MHPSELQTLLYQEIPLAAALGLQVQAVTTDAVSLSAPFAPNRNLHGTIFAGSQYCLATLAGWSLVTVWCRAQGVTGDVVLQQADIRYLKPLQGDPRADARLATDLDVERCRRSLLQKGRARLSVQAELCDAAGRVAAQFRGDYVVLGREGQHEERHSVPAQAPKPDREQSS